MMYRITLNNEVVAETKLSFVAQAAWDRASRDRDSAQHGGEACIYKDGNLLAQVQPRTLVGHPWPDSEVAAADLRDVLKAFLQLMRDDGWTGKEVAQAMTDFGLPTTRSQIDSLKGATDGKRREVTAAEITTMIFAVLNAYKSTDEKADEKPAGRS